MLGFSQVPQPSNPPSVSSVTNWYKLKGVLDSMQMWIERDTNFVPAFPTTIKKLSDHKFYTNDANGGYWYQSGGSGGSITISQAIGIVATPNPITGIGTIALDTAYTNGTYVRIQTQNPTASLNGGGNYELHSSGTFSSTLNWNAGRLAANSTQAATNPLSSIIVAGVSQSFSQPSAGSSVSGTQGVTITYNSNVTYTNTVTTTDSKTASSTTSYNFYPTYYIGYSSTNSPTDTELKAGINNVFPATTRVTSGTLAAPSGASFIFFAVPSTFGTPNVTINGLGVTYNNTTRSVTNASGYSQNYIIAVSPFSTSGGVTYSIN